MSVMSVSVHLPQSVVTNINRADTLRDFAVKRCDENKYLQAYEYYSQALSYFNTDEEKTYTRVSQIVSEIKQKMEPIGNLCVLHIPLPFADLVHFDMDPFCDCKSPPKGHFCAECCDRCPVTIARVYKVLERSKKERTAELDQIAILGKIKRAEVPILDEKLKRAREETLVLEEKLKRARENVEYLEETRKCTREEASDAEERVQRYRGW